MLRKYVALLKTVQPEKSISFDMDLSTLCAYFDACAIRVLKDSIDIGNKVGASKDCIEKTLFDLSTTLLLLKATMCDKGNFERVCLIHEDIKKTLNIDIESEV